MHIPRTRVKFCGMTRAEDAVFASEQGADAIGLIFHPKSPRVVDLATADEISRAVNPLCQVVAVVVNPEQQWLDQLLASVQIHAIQFHGDETPEFCAQFGLPYFKVIRMHADTNLVEICARYADASGILLDTYVRGHPGGTGQSFDWAQAKQVDDHRLIVAGGLAPENVVGAVVESGAFAIDVNSGVEVSPGVKDHGKIAQVLHQLSDARLR